MEDGQTIKHHDVAYAFGKNTAAIDIELTNKCPIHCSFCPREKTPKSGFMSLAHFQQTIARVIEAKNTYHLGSCGLGESILHPNIADFIGYATKYGFGYRLVTSATYFNRHTVRAILDAGLTEIHFSVTNIHADYELIYGRPFGEVLDNIHYFQNEVSKSGRSVKIFILIVLNHMALKNQVRIIDFWKTQGFERAQLLFLEEHNRSGSYDPVEENRIFNYDNTQVALDEEHVFISQSICPVPFTYVFIGWNGSYYLCSQDWEKKVALGHVLTHSIDEVNALKYTYLHGNKTLCSSCSACPKNYLHDITNNPLAPPRMNYGNFRKVVAASKQSIDRMLQ